MEFVGREQELHNLNMYLKEVKNGKGRVVLVEGPAGIGKTALIERFLKDLEDVEILKSRCESSSRYIPYNAFSKALMNYGSLVDIRRNELKRRIKAIARMLMEENKMVFVDEIGYGGGFKLYREIRKKIGGIYFTPRKPERDDGIWLTETKTEIKKVNPYNLEFEFLSEIHDFLQGDERRVVYIENLNYLVYIAGITRVLDFLQSVHSMAQGKHIIIISGKLEYLSEEERHLIMSTFDDKILVEWEERPSRPWLIFVDRLQKKNIFLLTNRKRKGKAHLYISPYGIHPTRLDFEIFEKITEAVKEGKDIVIECLDLLIHYNDKRRIYIWLKAVVDYAQKYRRRVYIVGKNLNPQEMTFFADLIDRNETRGYGNMEVREKSSLKFYDVIYSFLDYYSQKKPMVLVFEDIQWIDINSLELIHYLSRNIGKSRIMIIITYRSEDIVSDEDLVEILAKIQRERITRIMRLRPLSSGEIEKLLRAWNFQKVNFKSIYQGSEGNPLLAINMARYLEEGGNHVLPDTIRESIEMQIDRLDEIHLNFLRFLSVVGNNIPLDIVKDFYPSYETFMEKIENLFVKREDSNLRFIYSPYRDIIYKGISRDTRLELHRKIAQWMERRDMLFEAAYHYYMARDEKAIKYLQLAAEESIRMLAFRSAIEYIQKAIEIAEKYGKEDIMGSLYKNLGEWYMTIGEYRYAIKTFIRAMRYLPEEKVYLGTKIATCYRMMGKFDEARVFLNEYLKIAKDLDRARVIGQIGIIDWEVGNFKNALKNLREYLRCAKKYKSKIDQVSAYRNIASVYYMEGRYKDALKYAERALRIAEEIGDINEVATTYNVIGVINNHLTNYQEALRYLTKYMEISEKMGNLDYLARAYNNVGVTYEKLGEIKKAEEYYRKSVEIIEKIGNDKLLEVFYNNLGVLYSRHGNYLLGLEYMKKSLEISNKLGDKYEMCDRLISLCTLTIEMGKYFEAIDFCNRGIDMAKEKSYVSQLFGGYVHLARAYVFLKKFKRAREYLDMAKSLLKGIQEIYLLVEYYLTNAEYYMAVNKRDKADEYLSYAKRKADQIKDVILIEHINILQAYLKCFKNLEGLREIFERAIGYYEKFDYKKDLADTYYYYGLCLVKWDKEEGLEKLNKAMELYREMGLGEKIKEVEEKINGILS